MATGADVRDILELTGGENDGPISKKDLINSDKVRDNHKIPTMMPVPVFRSYPCTFEPKCVRVTQAVGLRPCHSHSKKLRLCCCTVLQSITKIFL